MLHFDKHTLSNDDNTVIVKGGEAFILKPEYRRTSYIFNLTQSRPTAVSATNGTFQATDFTKETAGTGDYAGITFKYAFQGTFNTTAILPKYAYYVGNDGSVVQNTSDRTDRKFTKALRGYILSQNLEETPQGAKAQPLSIDIDGVTLRCLLSVTSGDAARWLF